MASWLFGWGAPAGTLSIACERVLFVPVLPLEPSSADELRPPATLSGTITLSLARACDCSEIVVNLRGRATLRLAEGVSETSTTLDRSVSVECGPKLAIGDHASTFVIEFPSTTAPSESCAYGSIVHTLQARAPALKLHAERPIMLVAVSHPMGEPPRPINLTFGGFHNELGPYSYDIVADAGVVGGTFGGHGSTVSHLPQGHPDRALILSTMTFIRETITITPPSGTPPVTHVKLVQLEQTVLSRERSPVLNQSWVRLSSGVDGGGDVASDHLFERSPTGGLSFLFTVRLPGAPDIQVFRMPGHNELSPTTLAGVDTPIRVQHRIVFRTVFERHGKSRQLDVTKPIELASCRETFANVFLPSYAEASEHAADLVDDIACTCAMTMPKIVEELGAWPSRPAQAAPDPATPASDPSADVDPRPKAVHVPSGGTSSSA